MTKRRKGDDGLPKSEDAGDTAVQGGKLAFMAGSLCVLGLCMLGLGERSEWERESIDQWLKVLM